MSATRIGLVVVLPIFAATACGLSIGNKVILEIVMQKFVKFKEQYQKDQQTLKSFNKLTREKLQDDFFDKYEYEFLPYIFTKFLDEMKNEVY